MAKKFFNTEIPIDKSIEQFVNKFLSTILATIRIGIVKGEGRQLNTLQFFFGSTVVPGEGVPEGACRVRGSLAKAQHWAV